MAGLRERARARAAAKLDGRSAVMGRRKRPYRAGAVIFGTPDQPRVIAVPPDYAPDEDPLAGVLALRAFLESVGSARWKGISDLRDATAPEGAPADPEALIDAAGLSGEEARVLRLQAQGMTRLELVAASGLTPARLGRIITRIRVALEALRERWQAERIASLAMSEDADDGKGDR